MQDGGAISLPSGGAPLGVWFVHPVLQDEMGGARAVWRGWGKAKGEEDFLQAAACTTAVLVTTPSRSKRQATLPSGKPSSAIRHLSHGGAALRGVKCHSRRAVRRTGCAPCPHPLRRAGGRGTHGRLPAPHQPATRASTRPGVSLVLSKLPHDPGRTVSPERRTRRWTLLMCAPPAGVHDRCGGASVVVAGGLQRGGRRR